MAHHCFSTHVVSPDRQTARNLSRLRAAQGLKVQHALINLAEGKLLLD